jgi:hypothetical protein
VEPFGYDVVAARSAYEQQGWFHAPGGATPQLMEAVTEQVGRLIGGGDHELETWRYPDKKQQFLWELPEGLSVQDLCRTVAESTGLNPERTVLSERHLKVYSANAPALPPPHKDRSASTVTVGIGVDGPADSRLVLWPESDVIYNPFPTAAEWRESRHSEEAPEIVTRDAPRVEFDLRRGDAVLFRGANLYHERHRPACTTVLYLKFNDKGLDPLGEDPRTVAAEQRSRELEREGVSGRLRVALSPRVVGIRSEQMFGDLGVIESARMVGTGAGVRLSATDAAALRRLASDGPCPASGLEGGVELVERLARWGLVLLSPGDARG